MNNENKTELQLRRWKLSEVNKNKGKTVANFFGIAGINEKKSTYVDALQVEPSK